MGLSSYFKAKRPIDKRKKGPSHLPSRGLLTERALTGLINLNDFTAPNAPSDFDSSRNSISGRSTRSTTGSVFLDGIKHEVMVNFLYQQQCSHVWVGDGSGDLEGVLLRKSRGLYMTCPSSLTNSTIAMACATLNVEVTPYSRPLI